jgi:hypothetical protein
MCGDGHARAQGTQGLWGDGHTRAQGTQGLWGDGHARAQGTQGLWGDGHARAQGTQRRGAQVTNGCMGIDGDVWKRTTTTIHYRW